MTKPVSEREIVLAVLTEVLEDGRFSHVVLRSVLEKYQYLQKKERAFITRVTEGTLEHLIEIDYILDTFSKIEVKKMKPVIRNILRSSVYQLKYMDSVPDAAVCNEAVNLAVKKGFRSLKGFVNGLLRNVARNLESVVYPSEGLEALSIRYSMPVWILNMWSAVYDAGSLETMLAAFQEEMPLTIRCNQVRATPGQLRARLEAEGVKVRQHPYLPYAFWISGYDHLQSLKSFQEGWFSVQDVSSMLAVELSGVKEGDQVLDVCAAPGGKALHMAEKLNQTGHVRARDLTEYKVRLIEENIRREGAANIEAAVWDAAQPEAGSADSADIVMADVPCSGLGVLGRKTDLRYKVTPEGLEDLVRLQRKILSTVQAYVKPGGTLMYSTCTIHSGENEENVRWFLEHFPQFALQSLKTDVCEELRDRVDEEGWLQLLPGINKSDGFFIAKLIRRR